MTQTKNCAGKTRPPLDQNATGGIAPAGTKKTTAQQGDPGQAYPPALWIQF
ncbi:hypothetical protein [Mesorhizobium sp. NFR06]|uniref:hypothetical protein n=1 Tax=Mesorhizobium sp. NFR06 TaxID=1566290 RepID=UPI00165F52E1|nr:hypothetical protein [Mesorhizobium sp. NFR06]